MIGWLEKHRKISLIITLLIAMEIFYVSSIPGTKIGKGMPGFDMSVMYHFIVFFLLSFFLFMTIKGNRKIKIKYVLMVFFISVFYAISDEVHQMFVPLRTAEMFDILINNAGILSSTIICTYVGYKNDKTKHRV